MVTVPDQLVVPDLGLVALVPDQGLPQGLALVPDQGLLLEGLVLVPNQGLLQGLVPDQGPHHRHRFKQLRLQ